MLFIIIIGMQDFFLAFFINFKFLSYTLSNRD